MQKPGSTDLREWAMGPPSAALGAFPSASGQAASRRVWMARAWCAGVALAACTAGPVASARAVPNDFYAPFSGMRLLDQDGKPLVPQSLRGKVVLFNFIFTACSTVCPVQTHALVQLQRQLQPKVRERVHLVSVSLDPLSDTPRTLRAFGQRFNADFANWSFVTGRPDDIHLLAETLWLFRDGKGKGPLEDHNTSVWLVDAAGELRVRYAGNPLDTARLTRELDTLTQLNASVPNPAPVARR